MKTWLHFIGRQYYSMSKFAREAKKYGVSRRVSLADLKRMDWGDRVLLAILEGKSGVVFGEFEIERLSGLSPEVSAAIRETFKCHKVSNGGRIVKRGCGSYVVGATYIVENATLAEIAKLLESLKESGIDIGKPMVGGEFEDFKPLARLVDIPHRQGFRLFDYQRFVQAVQVAKSQKGKKLPAIKGQFYVTESAPTAGIATGELQEVRDYRRKEQAAATGA